MASTFVVGCGDGTRGPAQEEPSVNLPDAGPPDSATPDSATPGEPMPDGGPQETLNIMRIDGDFRGVCPTGPLAFATAEEWAEFVERCVVGDEDPAAGIDWETQEIRGAADHFPCPFAVGGAEGPSNILLGTAECGSALEIQVWSAPDYCFCDYYPYVIHLFVVDRGRFDSARYVHVPEAGCEEVTCLCAGGSVNACDVSGECETEMYPGDGLPPEGPFTCSAAP